MAEATHTETALAKLARWYKLTDELRNIKAKEMSLRREIFNMCFETKEGTQTLDLGDGHNLKGELPYNRKLDEAVFNANAAEMREKHGIIPDNMIRKKLELDKRNYNTLTDEQRAVFDRCLVIEPGSPSLKITKAPLPK